MGYNLNFYRKILVLTSLLVVVMGGMMAEAQGKKDPLYATIKTSMGDIVVLLFEEKAPKTVENFVALATGAKEWTDPKTGQRVKRPLYNGTIFHRVIPDFMIQGATPWRTGPAVPGIGSRMNSIPI